MSFLWNLMTKAKITEEMLKQENIPILDYSKLLFVQTKFYTPYQKPCQSAWNLIKIKIFIFAHHRQYIKHHNIQQKPCQTLQNDIKKAQNLRSRATNTHYVPCI